MAKVPRRKILIVEDEPSIRNIIYVLLAGLDCDGEIAYSGKQALGLISRSSFDAVLLDIRSAETPPQDMVSEMRKLQPSLVGRVLVITGEVTDPATMEWIEQNCLSHLPGDRLAAELWDRVRAILGFTPSEGHAP